MGNYRIGFRGCYQSHGFYFRALTSGVKSYHASEMPQVRRIALERVGGLRALPGGSWCGERMGFYKQ